MRKYLFVCFANINRSPYAARWFSDYCAKYGIKAEVKSAGLEAEPDSYNPRARVKLTPELVRWADKIFVMDKGLQIRMSKKYPASITKSYCLDIPDIFDPNLEEPPALSEMSIQEAVDYFNMARTGNNYIGRHIFEKVLQARLEEILGFK